MKTEWERGDCPAPTRFRVLCEGWNGGFPLTGFFYRFLRVKDISVSGVKASARIFYLNLFHLLS